MTRRSDRELLREQEAARYRWESTPPEMGIYDEVAQDDRVVLNLGPYHPAMHGVLHNIVTLEGEKIAGVDRKCFVVFVSSEPSSLQSVRDGVFCITDDLSEVANRLTNDKITLFTTTCSSGHPDWSVFQTEFFPEYLVAACLLQIAKCKEVNVEMNDSFWSKASREFSQVLGEEKQRVELSLDNGQQELEKRFAELTKANRKG